MKQDEKKFNSWLREQLPGHFMRVENTTMQGVPDINVCYQGTEIWIESKIYKGRYDSPLLEPEQHAWGFKRAHNGGVVWVVANMVSHMQIVVYRHPLEIEVQGEYLRIVTPPKFIWARKDFLHYCHLLFQD